MISYDRILNEIERQLNAARKTTNNHEVREALSAIRSLSEVALGEKEDRQAKIVPKMLVSNEVQPAASFEGKLLREEDANGGSLFDF